MLREGRIQSDRFKERALEVHLLPQTSWENALALQQRLVFEISGEPRQRAAIILCEHPPIVTVGRQGSARHILTDPEELTSRRLRVQWTNRGGGCWLHAPGQLAVYPILPLGADFLGLAEFRAALYQTLIESLDELNLTAQADYEGCAVRVGSRQIAGVGVAVNNWVSYHGCFLNVCSRLDDLELIQANPRQACKMTSIFRELRAPVRIDAVRENVLRHFVEVFGFGRYYLCNPPRTITPARTKNVATKNH